MPIKLIKTTTSDDEPIQFNPEHVAHFRTVGDGVSEITFVNGEKIEIKLRWDDLAGRITR